MRTPAKVIHAPLTSEQILFKEQLQLFKNLMDQAKATYWDKKKECKHIVAHSVDSHGGAWCAICGEDLGWYCPDSPDHACHYYTEKGGKTVKIASGELVSFPGAETHNPQYETNDCCLFCEAPYERK